MTSLFHRSLLALLAAAFTCPASAAPIISEFMASNRTTLADSDGAYSDWIELHNPDAEPVDLTGWYLTDNSTKRTKWQFPAVTIPPQGYLVVFASEKDRRDPASALHTNFALSADGEYLGLIRPDGATAAAEFAPAFPAQRADVSYGIDRTGTAGFLSSATPGAPNSTRLDSTAATPARITLATAEGTETFSSALPILVLDNGGFGPQTQADGEVAGAVQLHQGGAATFESPAGLKVRGSSSADFPKKGYSIELHDHDGTNRSVSLLGLAKSADWALVAPWKFDPSYVRNAFVYAVSNRLGRWAPRTRVAEVFVKQDAAPLAAAHYSGLGVLTERIKIAPGLIDLKALSPADVAGDAVTGGYLLKFDPPDADEFGWRTDRGYPLDESESAGTMLVLASPKAAKLAPEQQDYITGYVQAFENALFADRDSDWATRDYTGYIDRASWVDFHLLQVLAKNPDGLVRSAYFHKDRGGKLVAGPVWDFDRAMGSVDPRSERWDEWNDPDFAAPLWETGWWGVLARDPDFVQAWIDRWQILRRGPLATEQLASLARALGAQVDPDAAARDAALWPENASRFDGGHAGEVEALVNWLARRSAWIDGQFVAAPVVVTSAGTRRIGAPAGSSIVYTLDGSDPRASGGGFAPAAIMAGESLVVPAGATITVRIHSSTTPTGPATSSWSAPVTSAPEATAPVEAATAGSMTSFSVRAMIDPPNPRLRVTLRVDGTETKSFLARAVGPTLGLLGGADVLSDPVVRVLAGDDTEIASNRDWRTSPEAAALPEISAAAGAFPLSDAGADSAVKVDLAPGIYTVEVSSASGGRGHALAEVHAVGDASAMQQLSAHAVVAAEAGLVGGLTITGTKSRRVLVRAVGPGLAADDAAADTSIAVFARSSLWASNDDWSYAANAEDIANAAAATGLSPLPPGSRDAAVLLTLNPGTYTLVATTKESAGAIRVDVVQLP